LIKVVSFDLDGTLADLNFEEAVWFKGIPALYAKQHGIPFKKALAEVSAEYSKVSPLEVEWYDVNYWFRRLGLKGSPRRVLSAARHNIKLYPDTLPALRRLKKKFRLAIVSNATRDFIGFKLKADGLGGYFSEVFSAPSDFGLVKGNAGVFEEACRRLMVRPAEMVHVGDQYAFDVLAARKAGVKAFLLDRRGMRKDRYVVGDLLEFCGRLQGL